MLRKIAGHVYHGDYEHFLKALSDAYLKADTENEKILRPAWLMIIDKYSLDKKYKEAKD